MNVPFMSRSKTENSSRNRIDSQCRPIGAAYVASACRLARGEPIAAQQSENGAIVKLSVVLEDSPSQRAVTAKTETLRERYRSQVFRRRPDLDAIECQVLEAEAQNLAQRFLCQPPAPMVPGQVVPNAGSVMVAIPI